MNLQIPPGLLRFLRKNSTVYGITKYIGGPLYRFIVRVYSSYLGIRFNWVFPDRLSHTFRIGFALGKWEPETTHEIKGLLCPGSTFVDIGANIGYYTRLASEIIGPIGQVYAFEPEPDNFSALVHNTKNYRNVIPISAALSENIGLNKLYLSSLAGCHSLKSNSGPEMEERYTWVPTFTFDHFVQELGLSCVDLVKIDAEGAEPLILHGMKHALEEGIIKAMLLEYTPGFGWSIENSLATNLIQSFDVRILEGSKLGIKWQNLNDIHLFDELNTAIRDHDQFGCVNLCCTRKTKK